MREKKAVVKRGADMKAEEQTGELEYGTRQVNEADRAA